MVRCICKKEIVSWHFNFNGEKDEFERNDKVGEYLIGLLKKLKVITSTTANIAMVLQKVETNLEMRKWFLSVIKKHTHKTCYGWQCRMKITKIHKNCKIHGHQLITKSKKEGKK